MSRDIHAFTSYEVVGEHWLEIEYKNDEGHNISGRGGWGYIYYLIQYGSMLTRQEGIMIPEYDYIDDAAKVKEEGMELVEPKKIVKVCEAVIQNIEKLKENENPLIGDNDWYLFDTEDEESFTYQKDQIIYYAKKLLAWSKKGLYLVEERQ